MSPGTFAAATATGGAPVPPQEAYRLARQII